MTRLAPRSHFHSAVHRSKGAGARLYPRTLAIRSPSPPHLRAPRTSLVDRQRTGTQFQTSSTFLRVGALDPPDAETRRSICLEMVRSLSASAQKTLLIRFSSFGFRAPLPSSNVQILNLLTPDSAPACSG